MKPKLSIRELDLGLSALCPLLLLHLYLLPGPLLEPSLIAPFLIQCWGQTLSSLRAFAQAELSSPLKSRKLPRAPPSTEQASRLPHATRPHDTGWSLFLVTPPPGNRKATICFFHWKVSFSFPLFLLDSVATVY